MELRLLEYFIVLSEELHFTRAAERLGVSQPTLSHQIQLLEHQVGAPLFHRIGKKTYLSETGELLLGHARRVLHELEQAREAVKELQGLQRGRLAIGCSGNHLLTGTVAKFHQLYPSVAISVMELATDETRDSLLSNELDLGVVFLPVNDEHLESIPLFREELVLVVSKDHELAASSRIPLADLRGRPLMMLQEKYFVRRLFDQYCESTGFRVSPVLELSTIGSLVRMAGSNPSAAAVLPRSYLDSLHDPNVRYISIVDPVPCRDVGIVYRKGTYMCASMRPFVQCLIEQFQPMV